MEVLGGKYTPETIARRRKLAEALSQKAIGFAPKNLGEGLASIGNALAARGINNRLDEQETEGRADADRLFAAMQEGERAPGIGGIDSRLIDAASNPFLSAGQKAIVNAMMQRQFGEQDRETANTEYDRRFEQQQGALDNRFEQNQEGRFDLLGRQQDFTREQNELSRDADFREVELRSAARDAPSGYQFTPEGTLGPIPGGPADPNAERVAKPLPTSAVKLVREDQEALSIVQGLNEDLAKFDLMIEQGELDLGVVSNLAAAAQNNLGMSDENSRNYAMFRSTMEKMRNDSLRLNNGVQTEGDAQRAWNELVANVNDPQVVRQQLQRIMQINDRAANLRNMNIDLVYQNFGADRPQNALNGQGAVQRPADIPQAEWDAMPPEDQALFQ